MTLTSFTMVFRYQTKLLFRNWILWLLFLTVLVTVVFYQLNTQGTFSGTGGNFYSMLSSLIPATNAYFFNLLKVLQFL